MCGCNGFSISSCRNLSIAGNNASIGADPEHTFIEASAPSANVGKENDNWFDVANQKAYKKILGVWVLKGDT
jgi:hypothetical protein